MMKNKKYRVAIYIRVSTKKQVEEGYSLDAQKERLIKLCETNGYIVYKVYADEGKSGKDTNRPAFQEMMKDMKEGLFDKILVLKLDRISRSVIDLEIMIKDMQDNKVDFESASEKIDTSSSFGMMFVRLLGIFAQFERERISERVNDTFETMVQEARAISGSQPLGYKVDNGKVVIDEEKEEMVREIFDTYEKNHSIRRTALIINEKYKTTIKQTNLNNLLERTQFYGSYRGNDNYCDPYMTKERWDNIQRIKKDKKKVKVYRPDRFYLFSGLLIDPHCGNKLTGHCAMRKTNDIYYYLCSKNRLTKLCVSNKTINEAWLEKYLLENLDKYIKEFFEEEKKKIEYKNSKVKDNSKEIAKLKEELRRTTISFNKGRMEEDDYDKEYERLEKQLNKLQTEPVKRDLSNLLELTKIDWITMYNELDKEHRQIWWRSFIDKIVVDPLNYKKGKDYIQVYFL